MTNNGRMSVIGLADPFGADPETLILHRRLQAQRRMAEAARASNAAVDIEPVPFKPKRPKSKVDWAELFRSAEIT
jgi:hypothetical protein